MFLSRKSDTYYLWGIKGTLFLIPFLPLLVTPSLVFPYITGKNFAFRIMVEFAAVLWLGLISANREYRLRNSAITLSVLIFAFIVGLADLFGVSPYNSFWSGYERMEGYVTILHLMLYFLIVRSVLRTRKDWQVYFAIIMVVSVIVSVYAMTGLTAGKFTRHGWEYGNRIYGTIGNPPFLASYLLLSLFLGFILIINTRRLYLKFIYLFFIIINSITIYLTSSRGAILAAAAGGIMFIIFYAAEKTNLSGNKGIKKALLSVVTIMIILSIALISIRNTGVVQHDRTISRFATMFSDVSVQTRFSAWKLGWEGVKERPLLGWGQENFMGVYTVNPIPFVEDQIWVDRAHNIVIDWLVSAGILGLLSYLAIFGTAFYVLRRAFQNKTITKNEVFIAVTALSVYFIHNLFTFDTINTYILFFSLLAYIDNIHDTKETSGLKKDADLKNARLTSIGITLSALLVFVFAGYYLTYKPVKGNLLFARISEVPDDNFYSSLLDQYNKALSVETFGDAIVRQSMKTVSYSIMQKRLFAEKGALKLVERTAEELEKGIADNHHNLQYMTDLIEFYMLLAGYEPLYIPKTEALIRECIRMNPEYQRLYMVLADLYVVKKDYKGAYTYVESIADQDPQDDKKQLKLALAAIFVSREDIVSVALENVRKIRMAGETTGYSRGSLLNVYELYQVAQTYAVVKEYQKALQYYREIISIFPEVIKSGHIAKNTSEVEAKVHFEMALIYIDLDDRENAVKEAKRAAGLDPGNFSRKADELIYSANNKINKIKIP